MSAKLSTVADGIAARWRSAEKRGGKSASVTHENVHDFASIHADDLGTTELGILVDMIIARLKRSAS